MAGQEGGQKVYRNGEVSGIIHGVGRDFGSRKTALLKCPNRLNVQGYAKLLESNSIIQFLRESGEGAVFQQDGARCHTAISTRRWSLSQNVAILDGWPANSPDLSPIEQIWGIVKCFIIQRFGMTKPLTLAQLEKQSFKHTMILNQRLSSYSP